MIKVLAQTFSLLLIAFLAVSAFYYYAFASPLTWTAPPSSVDMHGYAWSQTIGWISFNCENHDAPGCTSYKVSINDDSTLTGYAWSDNIGWIKFGGLEAQGAVFPEGEVHKDAYIDKTGTSFYIYGWARACSATDDLIVGTANGDCSRMDTDPDAGGWDGWISFHCSDLAAGCGAASYGWQLSPTISDDISGYAWDDVAGWIQSVVTVSLPLPSITTFGAQEQASTTDTLETAFVMATTTQQVEIVWVAKNADQCQVTNGGSNGFDTSSATFGTSTTIIEPPEDGNPMTFAIECSNSFDTVTDSLTITNPVPSAAPTPSLVSFTAEPSVVRAGDTTDFSWVTTDANGCEVRGQGGVVGSASGLTGGPITSAAIEARTDFALWCYRSDGTGPVQVPSGTVTVQTAGTRLEN